jgi:hypothetical protein
MSFSIWKEHLDKNDIKTSDELYNELQKHHPTPHEMFYIEVLMDRIGSKEFNRPRVFSN